MEILETEPHAQLVEKVGVSEHSPDDFEGIGIPAGLTGDEIVVFGPYRGTVKEALLVCEHLRNLNPAVREMLIRMALVAEEIVVEESAGELEEADAQQGSVTDGEKDNSDPDANPEKNDEKSIKEEATDNTGEPAPTNTPENNNTVANSNSDLLVQAAIPTGNFISQAENILVENKAKPVNAHQKVVVVAKNKVKTPPVEASQSSKAAQPVELLAKAKKTELPKKIEKKDVDKLDKAAAEPIMPLPEILPSTPNISEKKVNEAPKIVAYEPVAPETLEKFKTDKIILPKIETQAAKLNSPTATIDKLAVNDRSETDPLQLVQEEDSRTAIKNNSELVPPKLNHIPPSSSTLAESGNDSGPADLSEVEAEDKKPFNPENYPSNVDEDSAKIEPQIIKEAMLHVIEELTIVEEHNTELVELIDNSVATQRLELKNKLSVISTAVDELNELIENSSGEAEPANQELQLLLTQFLEILDVQSDVFTEEFITRFYKNNRLSVQAPRPQSPNSKIDVGTREIKKLDKTAFLAYLTDLIGNKLKAIHSHIGKLSINHISFTGSVY